MRARSFRALLTAGLLWLSATTSVGHAGAPDTAVFGARNVHLGAEEWIAIGLHPDAVPIEVDASERDLEVCPASFDGQRPEDGNGSSWPSYAGFTECIALDSNGHATLPSTVVNTFHLAFLVRGVDGHRADIKHLTVSYEPQDPYFVVFPPQIEPDARSSPFVVTPSERTTVYAGAGSIDYARIRGVGVRVTQRGERVPVEGGVDETRSGLPYGPVTPGTPVTVRVRNDTAEPQQITLLVDWA